MSTPTLLDIKQVAAILGLSVGAAYRRHQRGQLPAPVILGKRSLRWRQEDLAAMTAPVKALVEYHRGAMIAGQAQHENEEQVRILERSGSEWVLTQAAHDAGYRLLDCAVSQEGK